MDKLMGLNGSKSQTSFFYDVDPSSIILPQNNTSPLSGALWYNLSLYLAAICAYTTEFLFVLSLMFTALPCYYASNFVQSETPFLGGIIIVITLPLTLAVYNLLKSFFILKISIEWSSFSIWRVNDKVEWIIYFQEIYI